MRGRPRALVALGVVGLALGCGRGRVPDPERAVEAWRQAVAAADAEALHAMLSAEAQARLSPADIEALLGDGARGGLRARADAFGEPGRVVEVSAEVRHPDGSVTTLVYEDGAPHIAGGVGWLGGPRTPSEAVERLRLALASRDAGALLALLTPERAAELGRTLDELTLVLAEPRSLPVEISGDVAVITADGGHQVTLRYEAGAWWVDDFR